MNKKRTIITLSLLIGSFLFLFKGTQAQDGESIFQQNCASCHTVGGGKLVGPDLAGVTDRREKDWLMSFIKSSQSMIDEGDETAVKVFNEFNKVTMPDQNLSDGEIKAVLSFIESKGGSGAEEETASKDKAKKKSKKQEKATASADDKPVKGDPELGADIFSGREPLVNGGPSCVSCHHVENNKILGGGRLAKDLTQAHSRLGEAGIKGMLKNPAFPKMKAAYKNKPIEKDEIAHITAFLKKADKERLYQHASSADQYFLWGGGIGILLLLSLIGITWINRRKKIVNDKIYQRQVR